MNLFILWDATHVHVIWCTTLLVKLLKYLKQKLLLLWRTCFLISTIGLTKAQRKNELSDFCDFCNKVMKHALDRTLLQSYFLSSDESQARFQHLKQHSDPITEVYRLFYEAVIPAFTTFNRFLRETPCIYFTS